MTKKIILVLSLIGILCSCEKKKEPRSKFDGVVDGEELSRGAKPMDEETKDVKTYEPVWGETHKMEDFVEEFKCVALETTDKSVIGYINQIEIMHDTIFVRDVWKSKSIRRFDMEGHYLGDIGKIGNGPFEYVEPTDMYVNDSIVLVNDRWQSKIICFDLSGAPKWEKKMQFFFNSFAMLEDGYILFQDLALCNLHIPTVNGYGLWVCDTTMHITDYGAKENVEKWGSRGNDFMLHKNGDRLYYCNMVTDTIYRVDSRNKLTAVMHIKTMDYKDILELDDDKVSKDNFNNGKLCHLSSYNFLSDSLVIFEAGYTRKRSTTFVNLKSGKTIGVEFEDGHSNMSRLIGLPDIRGILTTYKGWCVSYKLADMIGSDWVRAQISQPGYYDGAPEGVKENDMRIMESVTEESNPVLIFYKMKPW